MKLVSLTKSEIYAIQVGITFSAAQRIKLIDKGIVDPVCRVYAPRPRETYWTARSYDLAFTSFGHLVRETLVKKGAAKETTLVAEP